MGVYQRIIPKQSCILCAEYDEFCICKSCISSLTISNNRCQSCATKLNSKLSFCGQCLTHAPVFSKAYTLYDYCDTTADLIKRFKFDHQLCIGDFFAHQLNDFYQLLMSRGNPYDAIIPLPLSKTRMRERGFNQTHELLRIIDKNKSTFIDYKSVKRIKATRALSTLNVKERQQEIKGAFESKPMNYQNVLLVDDVMTTGSSLSELAKTVIKAGVQSCDVLTLARA